MSKSNTAMTKEYREIPNKSVCADAPPELTIGNKIVWKDSERKGRGVYALVDFAKGDVIEQSPVTIVPKTETDLIDEAMTGRTSVIDSYLLRWRPDVVGQEYCLGHGFLMLYNHSSKPNGVLQYDFDLRTISMVAGRDIQAGEEINFDYDVELWFVIHD